MNKQLKVKIKLKSAFLFLDILKKMEINFEYFETVYAKSDESEDNAEKLGKELIKILINGLDKAEDEVYLFLSNILELTKEDVEEIDIFEELIPSLKEYKGWQMFLGKLGQLN